MRWAGGPLNAIDRTSRALKRAAGSRQLGACCNILAVMRLVLALALMASLAGCSATPSLMKSADSFDHALSPVFAADLAEALTRLAALPDDALDMAQRRVRDCMQSRFIRAAPVDPVPGLAGDVLSAYRQYWTAVLMKQATAEQAETVLFDALARWDPSRATDFDGRAEGVRRALESQGWHVLGGVTTPLHELMLWRQQTSSLHAVALPGGDIEVKVTSLDGFASLGWAAWATCDRSHTGGWTTADGIMVVARAWDLNSEAYKISLLAHEAQHFSDYRRYPKLAQTDLEYRAKLVEIALADTTQRELLGKFASRAQRNRDLPHPFANHWLVLRLRARLGGADWMAQPRDAIARAALAELQAHSAALDAEGAASARSALPD